MAKFNKVLLIDFKEDDIPKEFADRLLEMVDSHEYVARDDDGIEGKVKDADALLVKISTKIDKELIDAASNLKLIVVLSTAFDAIDAKHAREKGIDVCNLGGYSTEGVAEFAISVALEHGRELERAKIQARREDFTFDSFMGMELTDKTLGVVGAGNIGSRIAEIGGKGFDMNVLYTSRGNKDKLDDFGTKKVELEELMEKSDVIAIALALNSETENMVSDEMLDKVKKGATIVNIAPMELVDSESILKRTADGQFTFICDHADDLPEDLAKKFVEGDNCIVYPPIAFRTKAADFNRWNTFVENVKGFLDGNTNNLVN